MGVCALSIPYFVMESTCVKKDGHNGDPFPPAAELAAAMVITLAASFPPKGGVRLPFNVATPPPILLPFITSGVLLISIVPPYPGYRKN